MDFCDPSCFSHLYSGLRFHSQSTGKPARVFTQSVTRSDLCFRKFPPAGARVSPEVGEL